MNIQGQLVLKFVSGSEFSITHKDQKYEFKTADVYQAEALSNQFQDGKAPPQQLVWNAVGNPHLDPITWTLRTNVGDVSSFAYLTGGDLSHVAGEQQAQFEYRSHLNKF